MTEQAIVENLNKFRKELFVQNGKSIETIPPAQHALIQQVSKAEYYSGFCWQQSLNNIQHMLSPPEGLDIKRWSPFRTKFPEASESSEQFLKCGYNPEKGCQGRCTGEKVNLK